MTSVTDGNGDTTGYAYNFRDQTKLETFDSSGSVTTSYHLNALKYLDDDSSGLSHVWRYDAVGKLTQERQFNNPSTTTMDYTYDAAGNLLTFTQSQWAGATTSYVYDDANQLSRIIEPGGSCNADTALPALIPPLAGSGCTKFGYDVNGSESGAHARRPGSSIVDSTSYGGVCLCSREAPSTSMFG